MVDGTEVVAKEAQNDFMPYRETTDPLKGRNLCFPKARYFHLLFFAHCIFPRRTQAKISKTLEEKR